MGRNMPTEMSCTDPLSDAPIDSGWLRQSYRKTEETALSLQCLMHLYCGDTNRRGLWIELSDQISRDMARHNAERQKQLQFWRDSLPHDVQHQQSIRLASELYEVGRHGELGDTLETLLQACYLLVHRATTENVEKWVDLILVSAKEIERGARRCTILCSKPTIGELGHTVASVISGVLRELSFGNEDTPDRIHCRYDGIDSENLGSSQILHLVSKNCFQFALRTAAAFIPIEVTAQSRDGRDVKISVLWTSNMTILKQADPNRPQSVHIVAAGSDIKELLIAGGAVLRVEGQLEAIGDGGTNNQVQITIPLTQTRGHDRV
jgi:hypothetical protein